MSVLGKFQVGSGKLTGQVNCMGQLNNTLGVSMGTGVNGHSQLGYHSAVVACNVSQCV